MTSQELAAIIAETGLTRKEWYGKVYLRSHHWKTLRKGKLQQVGAKCEVCGETHGLEVHHLEYRNIFDVKFADLQVLCAFHHAQAHGKYEPKKAKPAKKKAVNQAQKPGKLEGTFRHLEQNVKRAAVKLKRSLAGGNGIGNKTARKQAVLQRAQHTFARFLKKHPEFRKMTDFRM